MFINGCAIKEQKPGTMKGLITWQYNKLVGTKPDVGAEIYLLPSELGSNKITDEDATSYFMGIKIPENYYYAKVNGNGNYEIQNIKPGKYMVLIVSNNTNRNLLKDDYAKYLKENILTKYFSVNRADYFDSVHLYLNKFEVKNIEIISGATIDLSHDFGNTFF